jgi:hypothetical protein
MARLLAHLLRKTKMRESFRLGAAPTLEETPMCRAVICEKCKKTTWAGCGAHVDQVMQGVPKDKRCVCPREERGILSTALKLLRGR